MSTASYPYVIVGAGLTGASALRGLRQVDPNGPVLLLGAEHHYPYDRPPLSKKLWLGKMPLEKVYLHPESWYEERGVEVLPGVTVAALDLSARRVVTAGGREYGYDKLLLATGALPRRLPIPGGDLEGLYYYRYLDDYLRLREQLAPGLRVTIIGGSFVGSEMAAALTKNQAEVIVVYPETYLVQRVFPESLGRALEDQYRAKGVTLLSGQQAAAVERDGDRYVVVTDQGTRLVSDAVVIGVGVTPNIALAEAAGLQVGNGVVVDRFCRTSHPDVFAAGDVALFPYTALGLTTRVEHWDHALQQGKHVGRNLAGAEEPYDYMPYFYSDLFRFGYEAVGEVDSRLTTFADWQQENETGVIYYLRDGRVRGVMLCNVWEKVPAARELIQAGQQVTEEDLRGAIS